MDRQTMRGWVTRLGAGFAYLVIAWAGGAETPAARPWWDDFPTLVQTGDAEQALRVGAVASLCGAADDPSWGLYAQMVRRASFPGRVEALHQRGLKALTWFEGFGTAEAYIVQLQRDAEGGWRRYPDYPDLTRVARNAWGWKDFDGTGEVRWAGIHNYFDPEDFVQPYSREHRRYGSPPLTYPDGRPATGYARHADLPWTHRVFDAGGAKNVLGRVHFENPELNQDGGDSEIEPALLTAVPDPGYTPAEWARQRAERLRQRQTRIVSVGKDSACPAWIDYLRASLRGALDAGVDGLWVDNFSPWDSFNARPLNKAFGEWSVAGFRGFLASLEGTPQAELAAAAADPGFDVRQALQARCREWGGEPTDLRHPVWRDPRWLDDPVWRAYLVYKRQAGTAALSRYYHTVKAEAAAAGKPEFAVLGNDLPMFGLGWVRGDLDLVSTELNWGWSLSGGSRGLMPPPWGSYVPVYKLAREHARSRFVNLWMYVPEAQVGRPAIAAVLYYQGLASHALPMPHYPHRRDAGSEATDSAFFRFVRAQAPWWGARQPVETVGVAFSSSSQVAAMTPAGTVAFEAQTHVFSFWGWGTALTWLHVPWRALPEWKLTPEELAGLKVLIVPSAEVFPATDVPALTAWVAAGGRLVVAGPCGTRHGEERLLERLEAGSTLAPLTAGIEAGGRRSLGAGQVDALPADPGLGFYAAVETRPQLLDGFRPYLNAASAGNPETPGLAAVQVPWNVGLTLYQDPPSRRLFVDVNSTAIDLATDTLAPTPSLAFTVTLPASWAGLPVRARGVAPESVPELRVRRAGPTRLEVEVGPVLAYASLALEASEAAAGAPP